MNLLGLLERFQDALGVRIFGGGDGWDGVVWEDCGAGSAGVAPVMQKILSYDNLPV